MKTIMIAMSEFDKYSDNYSGIVGESVRFTGLDIDFFTKVKVDKILSIIEDFENGVVLDFGCGTGTTDKWLLKTLRNLHGVDVSEKSICVAREGCPEVKYSAYEPPRIPYEDNVFDYIFTINVMHHIPTEEHSRTMDELHRVLKNNGKIIIFEHNPFNPVTRHVFNNCPLDVNANMINPSRLKKLFSDSNLKYEGTEYILFFPFKSKIFRKIESFMKLVPMGAQYVSIAKKV